MISRTLVFLQFLIIFLMVLPLGEHVYSWYGTLFIGLGLLVGMAAIRSHKRGNFNIRPDIKEGCELVTEGIYRYVRHPMYLSVMLMMGGFALLYASYYEFVLYGFLVLILLVKLFYEEHLWQCHSLEYERYKKSTKRLIPFLF